MRFLMRWRMTLCATIPARGRLLRLGLAVLLLAAAAVSPARGQVSPEEHEKHHPGQGKDAPAAKAPGHGEGGHGGHEGRKAPPKELYPSLMDLPDLPPERREEIRSQARERMKSGVALLSEGTERLTQAVERDDLAAMQGAAAQMREGLARFDSGLAAERALAEGKAPHDVALQWFKREMNLLPPSGSETGGGPFGTSWFHFFLMLVLVAFAAAMIGMYFFKMRRAALLLQGLTGGVPPVPAAGAASGATPAPGPRPDGRPAALAAPSAASGRAPGTPGKWSGKLRISRIFQETPDVKTFRLMNPLGGELPFSYMPGQFLTVTVLADGKSVKRSYTIASSPAQHDYAEITVSACARSRSGCV
jgi:hypothetical protein